MPSLRQMLIAAAAGAGALITSGCVSVMGDGQRPSMMGEGHDCMKMMQAKREADPVKAEHGETGMKCKMMDKHSAAAAPPASSPAPSEEHQHTPDSPAAAH